MAECYYVEYCFCLVSDLLSVKPFMLSVIMLSVIMLSVIMLNVVMLHVIMLNVVAPKAPL